MLKMFRNLLPFIVAAAVFACVSAGRSNPVLVEKYYSTAVYPVIASLLSRFSCLFPVSLWDLAWSLTILLFFLGLVAAVRRKIRFSRYFLRVGQGLAILYSLFYVLWGFNYYRLPAAARLGLGEGKPDTAFFRTVLDGIITKANSSFTVISKSDYGVIDSLVEAGFRRNSPDLATGYPAGKRTPKPMIFSLYFAMADVSGYFGPLFNETHINSYLLPLDFPFVAAHEKAHQFGIASEAEANLAAWIVCSGSEDKRLRYSSSLNLLLYFLSDALKTGGYHSYLKKLDDRVLADLRKRSAYYNAISNPLLGRIQRKANDVYLKSNHIKQGIINYNQVVELVLLWQRRKGA